MNGRMVPTAERLSLARQAQQLRGRGWFYREIAAELGVSRAYAWDLVTDPDGAKARERKDRCAGVCVDCGKPTSGSMGRRPEPRCTTCANVKSGAERKVWTRDELICAIQDWAVRYGEHPAMPDWNPVQARRLNDEARARRFEDDDCWPWFITVVREFGTWNAGMAAAGFQPRARTGTKENTSRRRSMRAKAAA